MNLKVPTHAFDSYYNQMGIVGFDTLNKVLSGGEVAANNEIILNKIALLEEQVAALKKTNVTPITASASMSISQTDSDVVLSAGEETVTGKATITAKSIDVKNLNAENSNIVMSATSDITVSNLNITGDLPKATSNAQVSINTEEYVKITSSNFEQTSYNALEIGLQKAPKSVIVDGLYFGAALSNNAILIFQHQDDAIITISNCHFASVSNAVRISNKLNKKATINFINCTVDKWDANYDWAGFLIMEDYSSKNQEECLSNNLFAPNKLTINFINCTGPNGIAINPTKLSEVCGTRNDKQLFYVYCDKGSDNGFVPYGDGSRYPTFTFK